MKLQVLLSTFIFCVFLSFSGISLGDGEPVITINKKNPSTVTASDGSLSVAVSGGSGPYTIYFTSTTLPGKVYNQSSVSLEGLKAGSYLFTIQDSKGHIINKSIDLQ